MDNAWQPQAPEQSNEGSISIPSQDIGPGGGGEGEYHSNGNTNGNGLSRSRSRSPGNRGRSDGVEAENPGNNLHVSGLSKNVDNRELESAFAKIGRVSRASVVYDPHTRESRLFGFVTMETPEEADAAVTALNATEMLGKVITVARARRGRARTPTPGKYHGPSKRRGDPGERPYDPRPYDSRYTRDYDDRRGGRGGRYDDYDDRRGGRGSRYDDYRGSGRRDYRDDRDRDRYREVDSERDRYRERDRDYERRY